MKNIKKFKDKKEYREYINENPDLPNVSYVSEDKLVYYNPTITYEYVDLGLPSGTKWATQNVGAMSETHYGLYFAWAEIEGYYEGYGEKKFSWNDYKYTNDGGNTMTKYNRTDNLETLLSVDDAATVICGQDWHMPSETQMLELIDCCSTEWVTNYQDSGINGRLFTSSINGNTLFFPAGGLIHQGIKSFVGSQGSYWSQSILSRSQSPGPSAVQNSWELNISDHSVGTTTTTREQGFLIRPVKDSLAITDPNEEL